MKRIIFSLALLIITTSSTSGQSGILRGKIIDAETGEELIGATVILVATITGASADFDGNYTIAGISTGTYDAKCQFISYDTKTITGIEIKEGEVSIQDFALSTVSIGLQEVVVEAKAITRTENAMLNLQRKSSGVLDGISAQQISKAGDSDAAGALKRVTGVSVEGGKYVYVRGLGDRYMMTTLNTAEIPGLDPNRNTVQMDLFPSNIIENMVVYKSFSPDLPGSFTGGLVDIVTRDFPERLTFQFSASLGYNTQSSFNKDFLSYEGGKTDWLGVDDGTRSLPGEATGQIPEFTGSTSADWTELTNITSSFNKTWQPEKTTSLMDQSYTISAGNQVKLFGKPLGFTAGLTYKRDLDSYDNGKIGNYQLVGSNSKNLNTNYNYTDVNSISNVLWSAIASGVYKINSANKVGLMLLYNRSGNDQARYIYGVKPSDDPTMKYQTRTLAFTERAFASGQLKGEHFLENFAKIKINWLGAYTRSMENNPDLRYFTNNYFILSEVDTLWEISPTLYPVPSRFFREMVEDNFNARLNIEVPFDFQGGTAKVKFGGAVVIKDRSFSDKKIDFRDNNNSFTTFNRDIPSYVSDNNIGQNTPTWTPDFGLYVSNSELDDLTNSYDGSQKVYASYAMINIPFFSRLKVMAGARVEKTNIEVTSLNPSKKKGNLDELDVLPAINLTYELKENMNMRAAYSRTLARPSFRELAPFASYDFVGAEIIVGNPELKRTLIDNFDLRWEYFMRPGEIVAFSAFYKNFHNPIERTFNPEAANPELTWRNVNEASVYGIEAEFRKKLDFVNALKNFKLGVNVTLVKSQVNVDKKELDVIHATEPGYPETRVMAGQSPYVVNAIVEYENDPIGFNANLSYNIFGKRLVTVINGGTPNIYEQPAGLLNINASKKLGNSWSLKLKAQNLLNPLFKQTYTRWYENSTWKGEEYVYRSFKRGMKFSLGVSYIIN